MSGYVRGERDRFSHPLFAREKFCRGYAWDWLVANAAWQDHQIEVKGRLVTLRRGQLSHSVRYMAEAWNWSKSAVERFLRRLETETMIGTDSGTGQMVITICNYDRYQSGRPETETMIGTDSGTAAGQQRDKEEEGKDIKEEEIPSLTRGSDFVPADGVAGAVTAYNAAAERNCWPRVQKLTPSRRQALKARMRDCGGPDGWMVAIEKAEASRFIRGPNRWFGFDWLCKQANFTKLMEGNYDDRSGSAPNPEPDSETGGLSHAQRIRQAQRRDRGFG